MKDEKEILSPQMIRTMFITQIAVSCFAVATLFNGWAYFCLMLAGFVFLAQNARLIHQEYKKKDGN